MIYTWYILNGILQLYNPTSRFFSVKIRDQEIGSRAMGQRERKWTSSIHNHSQACSFSQVYLRSWPEFTRCQLPTPVWGLVHCDGGVDNLPAHAPRPPHAPHRLPLQQPFSPRLALHESPSAPGTRWCRKHPASSSSSSWWTFGHVAIVSRDIAEWDLWVSWRSTCVCVCARALIQCSFAFTHTPTCIHTPTRTCHAFHWDNLMVRVRMARKLCVCLLKVSYLWHATYPVVHLLKILYSEEDNASLIVQPLWTFSVMYTRLLNSD